MSENIDEFNNKFKIKEFTIYKSEYWVWSLRPVQATLGSGILSLKRECSAFSGLTQEEFSDLNNIIKVMEKTINLTFNYDIMNYLMLMMLDNQVHYHVIPRYKSVIDFKGISWRDSNWPGIPNLSGDEPSSNILHDIQNVIKSNLIA